MPIHDWTRVGAGVFHDFHTTWLPDIKRSLKRVLPTGYYGMVEQHAEGPIPDVLALKRDMHESNGQSGAKPAPGSGNTMVALAEAPPRVQYRSASESQLYAQKARHIAIRHVSGDQIVAVIEIVSPGNKQSSGMLQAFVAKAVEWIQSGVHVLIVDLFPPTPRDPRGLHAKIWSGFGPDDFAPTAEQPLTLASYSAAELKEAFVQLAAIGEPLPEMPLFLEPGQYINLPLEASYMSAFVEVPEHWQEVLK